MRDSPVPAAADTRPRGRPLTGSLPAAAVGVLAGLTRFEEKKLRGALRSRLDKSVLQMSFLFVPLPLERAGGTTWGGKTPSF